MGILYSVFHSWLEFYFLHNIFFEKINSNVIVSEGIYVLLTSYLKYLDEYVTLYIYIYIYIYIYKEREIERDY